MIRQWGDGHRAAGGDQGEQWQKRIHYQTPNAQECVGPLSPLVPLGACAVTVASARLKMYCRDCMTCSQVHAAPKHYELQSQTAKQLAALALSPSSTPFECLPPILLELPIPVVEGTDLAGLEPSRDAVEVEGVLQNR